MRKNRLSFGGWLMICFAFIGIMIAARILYSGSIRFLFLVWNIFLGWLPYLISLLFCKSFLYPKIFRYLLPAAWLLFFPNALYIVTDIIHLKENETVPLWFDAILLFTSSFAGLAMAFASARNAESFCMILFPKLSKRIHPFLIICFFFLGSFGVYLGRFQRWNSWDIINDPFSLFADILSNFTSPVVHYRTWAVTILLTLLYSVFWFFLKVFPRQLPGDITAGK